MTVTMTATTAEALHHLWADGINQGDIEGLVTLYEDNAAYVTAPNTTVTGLAAIREAISGLLALSPTASIEPMLAVHAPGIALLVSRWRLTGTGLNGQAVSYSGQTADVVRKQPDGTWRFAVDNPWGDAAAGN